MATAEWTVLEKLLLAQAVYKFGEDNWFQIARSLKQHTMLKRQPDFFNQKSCSLQYYLMIENLETEKRQTKSSTSTTGQDMPPVVKLARQLYMQRMEELKRAIKEDEDKFLAIVAEIDEIRAGKWDEKLLEMYKEQNPETQQEQPPPVQEQQPSPLEQPHSETMPIKTAQQEEEEETLAPSQPPVPEPTPETANATALVADQQQPAEDIESFNVEDMGRPITVEDTRPQPSPSGLAVPAGSSYITAPSESTIPSTTQETTNLQITKQDVDLDNAEPVVMETTVVQKQDEMPESITVPPPPSPPPTMTQQLPPEPIAVSSPTEVPQIAQTSAQQFPRENIAVQETDVGFPQATEAPIPPSTTTTVPSTLTTGTAATVSLAENREVDTGTLPITEQSQFEEREDSKRSREEEEEVERIFNESKRPRIENLLSKPSPEPVPSEPALSQIAETSIAQDTLTQSTEPVKDQTGASAPTDSGDAGPKEEAEERPATEGSENNAATPPASYSDKKQQQQQRSSDEQRQQKSWQKNITLLWREIANHKNGAMFMNPIKEATAPSYYDIVKHPMDLKTIKSRIRDGVIKTTVEFERDVVLMLTNSLMYNKEGTEMYQMALEMLEDVQEQMKLFKTADSNSSASSHTRKASIVAKDRQRLQ